MAVAVLPLFTLFACSMLYGFAPVGMERYLFSFIFAACFLFVWALGGGVKQCISFEVAPVSLGVALASVSFWALALVGWFLCIAQPLLSKDSGPGEVDIFSWDSQSTTPVLPFEREEIKPGKGNVLFVGAVIDGSGKPVSGHEMTLIFNNYKLGARVRTDASGEFAFRMPPGVWRFDGVYAGKSEFSLITKKGEIGLGESIVVDKEGRDKWVNIRIEFN